MARAAAVGLYGYADLVGGGECGYNGGWWPERLHLPTLGWRQLRFLLSQRVVAETVTGASAAPAAAGALFGVWLAPTAATAATTSAVPVFVRQAGLRLRPGPTGRTWMWRPAAADLPVSLSLWIRQMRAVPASCCGFQLGTAARRSSLVNL